MGGASKGIELDTEIDDLNLSMDLAIPCGIIVNELMTNAMKYAFPNDWPAKKSITVRFGKNHDGHVTLVFKDNGVGLPDNIDCMNNDSLGMRLVSILVESQMKGGLSIDRTDGTEFIIAFPEK